MRRVLRSAVKCGLKGILKREALMRRIKFSSAESEDSFFVNASESIFGTENN